MHTVRNTLIVTMLGSLSVLGMVPAQAASSTNAPPTKQEVTKRIATKIAQQRQEHRKRGHLKPTTTRPVNSLIVRYRPNIKTSVGQAAPATAGLLADATVSQKLAYGFTVVDLPTELTLARANHVATRLESSSAIISAEPNSWNQPTEQLTPVDAPNDPSFSDQWDLDSNSPTSSLGVMNLRYAWARTRGDNAPVVAVIDTGSTSHPDLAGRWLPGYDMVSDDLVANDGDGRDSDASDPGDWVTPAESDAGYFRYCSYRGSSWHGTHVAGTIGATPNNATGIAGMINNARILPVRVLGKCGGTTSDVADGITWASGGTVPGIAANPHPAKVLNLSLGGQHECGTYLQTAINGATARGAAVVVSAGNSNDDAANYGPANCDNVITVGAIGSDGERTEYSNYGDSVDIMAPGGDNGQEIYSTVNSGSTTPGDPSYGGMYGTSMAAPHVSATAALLLSRQPAMTPAQVEARVKSSAAPLIRGIWTWNGCDNLSEYGCGAGSLDPAAALDVTSAPSAVSKLRAIWTGNGTIQVRFNEPSPAANSYTVALYDWNDELIETSTQHTSSFTLAPEINDDQFPFRVAVTATNPVGTGMVSSSDIGYPAVSAPNRVRVTSSTSGSATVTWQPPTDGDVKTYSLWIVGPNEQGESRELPASARSASFTNLGDYGYVEVTISAITADGDSGNAADATTVTGYADAPSGFTYAYPAPGSATVSWDVPDNGGAPIIRYEAQLDDGPWLQVATPTYTATGLTTGQPQLVRVRAVTGLGVGLPSEVTIYPVDRPGAPVRLTQSVNGTAASLTWGTPLNPMHRNAVVTGYAIQLSPNIGTVTTTGTTAQLRGLAQGTTYTATVRAMSEPGLGAPTTITFTTAAAPRRVAQQAPGVPSVIRWRKSAIIRGTTSARIPLTITATPARVCRAQRAGANWRLIGTGRGVCAVLMRAAGNTAYLPLTVRRTVRIR